MRPDALCSSSPMLGLCQAGRWAGFGWRCSRLPPSPAGSAYPGSEAGSLSGHVCAKARPRALPVHLFLPSANRSTLPGPLIVCSLGGRTPGIICCPVTRVPDSHMSSPRERNQPLGLVAPGAHLDCAFCCERSAGPGASVFSPDHVFNRCSPRVCCHPGLSHHCPCLDSGRSLQMASPLALVPLRSGP